MLEKLTPYMLYIKLALAGLVVAGVAYGSWHFRGLGVAQEKQEAVDKATAVLQAQYDAEQKLRKMYEGLADEKFAAIVEGLSHIKQTHTTVTNNITKEVAANPQFYNQTLPPEGYKQWITARNLINDAAAGTPASSGQPASAPVSSSQPR